MKRIVIAFFLDVDVGDESIDDVNQKLTVITDFSAVCTNVKNDQNHRILNVKVEGLFEEYDGLDDIEDADTLAERISSILEKSEYVHVDFFEIAEKPRSL